MYNEKDGIQTNGGSIGNFGRTNGREYEGAENIQFEDFPSNYGWKPLDAHSYMHHNPDIWDVYIKPKLK